MAVSGPRQRDLKGVLMPQTFVESMNNSIDAVVPLAMQLQRQKRQEAIDAEKNKTANLKILSDIVKTKQDLEIKQLAERIKAGIGMTPKDVIALGGTPQYQDVSATGMDATGEADLRSKLNPNLEDVTISPTQIVPGREFPPEDFEGATKFDVSGRVFQPPVPLALQEKIQTMEAQKLRDAARNEFTDKQTDKKILANKENLRDQIEAFNKRHDADMTQKQNELDATKEYRKKMLEQKDKEHEEDLALRDKIAKLSTELKISAPDQQALIGIRSEITNLVREKTALQSAMTRAEDPRFTDLDRKIQDAKAEERKILGKYTGETAAPKAKGHPLSGQKPGRYKVDGKIIKWDGTKELQ
jgi:hypothetical protein